MRLNLCGKVQYPRPGNPYGPITDTACERASYAAARASVFSRYMA
jgi:hypothetical protein